MPTLKYRVYCTTDNVYRTVESGSVPTECPDNNQHTIDSSMTIVLSPVGSGTSVVTQDVNGSEGLPALDGSNLTNVISSAIGSGAYILLYSIVEASTTSETPLEMESMKTTSLPAAGSYLATLDSKSNRSITFKTANHFRNITSIGKVSVNGNEHIEVRWETSKGTVTVDNRSLLLIKVQ